MKAGTKKNTRTDHSMSRAEELVKAKAREQIASEEVSK